jgi:hypothetical protein
VRLSEPPPTLPQPVGTCLPPASTSGWRELVAVLLISGALAVGLTYPLAFEIGRVGRIDNGDGQFSIWNVAWVARTLVVDPRHVFDANIFYPHRWTLAYSESNIGAGMMAVPAYWATRNPFVAHNVALLLSFVSSAAAMYYLTRYLTRDRRAAAVAAICFAYCPYVFGKTAEIQLLMTAGLPLVLLAFHSLSDRPTPARGSVLGLALTAQAACCGYYAVFAVLMVGWSALVIAGMRRCWSSREYWAALGGAAVVAVTTTAPFFVPYILVQRVTGFSRPLAEALRYSANLSAYLASSSYAHAWMLSIIPPWREVLFPGYLATICGLIGWWTCTQRPAGAAAGAQAGISAGSRATQWREIGVLYGSLVVLAAWASFGPQAGLYAVLYRIVPLFQWLRAPSRFGLLVTLGLSVLTGATIALRVARHRRGTLFCVIAASVAVAELRTAMPFVAVPPFERVYHTLSKLPRGPVIELPFFYPAVGLFRHTTYMLNSTTHWMPLVNGYSDYTPPDFMEHVMTLAPFPSRDAFKILEPDHVRYAVFHMSSYNTENRNDILARLGEFQAYLRLLYIDDGSRLYEIVGYPP